MNLVAVGEAIVELAPVSDSTYWRGFAGDKFNTAWHMAQALNVARPGLAKVGFVTRVGVDRISDAFVAVERGRAQLYYWRNTSAAPGFSADAAFWRGPLPGRA